MLLCAPHHQEDELAFCRVTQMAFLRLITNPAIIGRDALLRRQAWDAMDELMADSRVRFLSEPETLVPLWKTLSKKNDRDHLLWTDDYLAAFAQAIDAELVTLDGVFRTRYPAVRVIDLLSDAKLVPSLMEPMDSRMRGRRSTAPPNPIPQLSI